MQLQLVAIASYQPQLRPIERNDDANWSWRLQSNKMIYLQITFARLAASALGQGGDSFQVPEAALNADWRGSDTLIVVVVAVVFVEFTSIGRTYLLLPLLVLSKQAQKFNFISVCMSSWSMKCNCRPCCCFARLIEQENMF